MQDLLGGGWLEAHDNLVINGPTGVGKSWLACVVQTIQIKPVDKAPTAGRDHSE